MISVIIPCFNAAATIGAAIGSALDQDVDAEIIVLDDGSTDGSSQVIANFAARIRFERTPNRGASAARNRGTELARGEFLQYLDADDTLAPGTLAARRSALEASGADVACTDWQRLVQNEAGGYRPGEVMRPDTAALAADAEAATAVSDFWAPPAALMYRRSIVETVGKWPSMQTCEDARFLFEAAARGAKFVHVPGVGAQYRVAPDSLSRRDARRFIEDCATNARDIEARWRMGERLTNPRAQALARMWWHVAVASLLGGFAPFEEARDRYHAVAPRSPMLEVGGMLRRLVGREHAASLLDWSRRRRHAVRQGVPRQMRQAWSWK